MHKYKFGNHDSTAATRKCYLSTASLQMQWISIRFYEMGDIYPKDKIEPGMISVRFNGIHCIWCMYVNIHIGITGLRSFICLPIVQVLHYVIIVIVRWTIEHETFRTISYEYIRIYCIVFNLCFQSAIKRPPSCSYPV